MLRRTAALIAGGAWGLMLFAPAASAADEPLHFDGGKNVQSCGNVYLLAGLFAPSNSQNYAQCYQPPDVKNNVVVGRV